MEEVSSTKVLESEILESSRKKAAKALKDGEVKREALKREIQALTDARLAEMEKSAETRIAKFGADIESRFPLERSRLALMRMEEVLSGELDRVLSKLDRRLLLGVLKTRLSRAEPYLSGGSWTAECEGLEESEARSLLEEAFPRAGPFSLRVERPGSGVEIAIVAGDGLVRFHCGLSSIRADLLRDKRGTLVKTLFPSRSLS